MPDPIHQTIPPMTTLAEITAAYCAAFNNRIYAKSMAVLDALPIKPNPTNAYPTYFGRKRRARRARGRRIEAKRPYSSAALAWRVLQNAKPKLVRILDSSLDETWGEITGDGTGKALPPIPHA